MPPPHRPQQVEPLAKDAVSITRASLRPPRSTAASTAGCTPPQPNLSEGRRPSDSPTVPLARAEALAPFAWLLRCAHSRQLHVALFATRACGEAVGTLRKPAGPIGFPTPGEAVGLRSSSSLPALSPHFLVAHVQVPLCLLNGPVFEHPLNDADVDAVREHAARTFVAAGRASGDRSACSDESYCSLSTFDGSIRAIRQMG